MPETLVRQPAVAGTFYSADAAFLRDQIESLAEKSGVNSAGSGVAGIVVPHAGYPYSGYTAACAYARVRACAVKRVVLMGVSHHFRFDGVSLPPSDAFQTPIGPIAIDTHLRDAVTERVPVTHQDAHGPEHALEVQLPFIQVLLGELPILPILFGGSNPSTAEQLAGVLNDLLNEDDLVVATTDLSHYLIERQANAIDKNTLETLMKRKPDLLLSNIEEGHSSMCSAPAVAACMHYANRRGATEWQVLDYRTSADASGDTSRVVGYAAVSMEMSSCV